MHEQPHYFHDTPTTAGHERMERGYSKNVTDNETVLCRVTTAGSRRETVQGSGEIVASR